MSFPLSFKTNEWKRVDRLWYNPIRQAEIIQKSWVYDYAQNVNTFTNSTIELSKELSKFWLKYSDISEYVKGKILWNINTDELLLSKVSKEEIEMLSDLINKHISIILDVNGDLKKLGIDENDFSQDVKIAFYKTLGLELSIIPDYWKWSPELTQRYNILSEVIQSNPDWWNEWKFKIELQNNWIKFLDNKFILNLWNFWELSFKDVEKIYEIRWVKSLEEFLPSSDELRKIYEFIISAWEENKQKLAKFLWLKIWNYWTNSKAGYLLNGMSYYLNLNDWILSYSPQTNIYNICWIKRY